MSIIEDVSEIGIVKSVKSEVDRRYKLLHKRIKRQAELYPAFFEDDKPLPVVVNGQVVGSISKTKRVVKHGLEVEHPAELAGWLAKDGYGWLLHLLSCPKVAKAVTDELASMILTDGEVPPGCDAVEFDVEVDNGIRVNGCTIDDIVDALGPTLPYKVANLLEGGADGAA